MKITHVETYLLDVPLKQRAITDSQTRLESVEFIAVRVDTDEGIWGRKLEEYDVYWLEEPMNPFDKKAHAELAHTLDLPIAIGETVYTKYDFRDYIEMGAVDVVQADCTKLSGIDEWLDVAALARCYNLEVIPHTNVQQKLHVQLAAASPNVPMVEYCYESLVDIWENPVRVENGYYTLPQEPGLGCKFTDKVLKECRVG